MEREITVESPMQVQSEECHQIPTPFGDGPIHDANPRDVVVSNQAPNTLEGPPLPDVATNVSEFQQESPHIDGSIAPQEASPSFVEELKALSFEATAERHLGSSSGIAFAKLTQTVLRRLTPDTNDFLFTNVRTTYTGPRLFDSSSPLDLFDPSLLESLSESMSLHPMLFGDIALADRVEPSDAIVALHAPGDQTHINALVDFYFAHSHTLYPIIHRGELLQSLQRIRENPQDPVASSPLSLFRIWMVLAIGSTAYSSVCLTEEAESRVYYNKALEYLEQAMACGEMVMTPVQHDPFTLTDDFSQAALEAMMLQVSYSFFNQLGPSKEINLLQMFDTF
jgi:hypothetical protein